MMNKSLQVFGAGALICLFLGVLAFSFPRTRLATSVVDLLPGGSPETRIIQELAEVDQGKLLTVRLAADGAPVAEEALNRFVESLTASSAIENVHVISSEAFREPAGVLFRNRYALLLPGWLDENIPDWRTAQNVPGSRLATRIVDNLEAYLSTPESFALLDTIPQDPFLLMRQLELAGKLVPEAANESTRLWIRQAESPFSEDGQIPVFEALRSAHEAASALQPSMTIEYTGVSVFAHASKAGIKGEIQRLNLWGFLAVLLIAIIFLRDVRVTFRIFIILISALLAASAVTFSVFETVHVVALVIGSILSGIAVDYALHLMIREASGLSGRRIIKAVVAGSLSSALGFGILLWAPLPFLQQVGAFVGSGLLTAVLMSLLLRPAGNPRETARIWQPRPASLPKWTGLLLLALTVPGLLHIGWRDSISDLEYPLPQLKANADRINAETSLSSLGTPWLVLGNNLVEARDHLEQVVEQFPREDPGLHAGTWIPAFEEVRRAWDFMSLHDEFPTELKNALEKADFVSGAFREFFTAWKVYMTRTPMEETYQQMLRELSKSLPGPLRSMIHEGDQVSWYMVLAPDNDNLQPGPHLFKLDQANLLSTAFSEYRKSLILFAGICLAVLAAGILLLYGPGPGGFALGIPAAALLMAYGVCGYIHSGIGLFHVVGGILAFCISLDYALFAVESRRSGCRLPGSVTVSTLTTLCVFGLLSTSRIPGIHQMAVTVICTIAISMALALSGWPFWKKPAVPGTRLFKRLPHGKAALMIRKAIRLQDREIEVECFPNRNQDMPPECLLEAMAQSAALWLAASSGKPSQPRTGMLVVVQKCDIHASSLEAGQPSIARVRSQTEAADGLLVFEGICFSHEGDPLMEATFSIFIPPVEAIG
jgi:predicted exporter